MPHETAPLPPQPKPCSTPPLCLQNSGGFCGVSEGFKNNLEGMWSCRNLPKPNPPPTPTLSSRNVLSEMSRAEPEAHGGGFSIKIQPCVRGYFYRDVMERVLTSLLVAHTWRVHQWLGGTFSETVKPQTMQNPTPRGTSPGGW